MDDEVRSSKVRNDNNVPRSLFPEFQFPAYSSFLLNSKLLPR